MPDRLGTVKITDLTLRDGIQSLLAAVLKIEYIEQVLNALDRIGFHSLECWGGETFGTCLTKLNEDPWRRLDILKKNCNNTKLQMLLRGQNLVSYKQHPDETVRYFVQKSIAHGIGILRIFDGLNDFRNIATAVEAAKKEKAHVQIALAYTTGPIFSDHYYTGLAKTAEGLGADSICLKDMAGLLTPYKTYNLIKKLKQTTNLPLQLHTHYTTGQACMNILKAVEAGVNVVDTAMSPLALGTSHAPTESIVVALKDIPYDTGLDLKLLGEIRNDLMSLRKKWIDEGVLDPRLLVPDTRAQLYQVPGGMMSVLLSQLKTMGHEDKFEDVLAEIPRIRAECGYPPLVTPAAQIIGAQATNNVILKERYKVCTDEFKDLVAGKYGKTPVEISKDFQKKIIGDTDVTTCRPADLLKPNLDRLRQEIKDLAENEEDVLSYAMHPEAARKFFKNRKNKNKLD